MVKWYFGWLESQTLYLEIEIDICMYVYISKITP